MKWENIGSSLQRRPRAAHKDNDSWDTIVPRVDEDCITQASEELGERLTQKYSLEFSLTKSRKLTAPSNSDELFLNSYVWVQSWTILEKSWNYDRENQETLKDRWQNEPHSIVDSSVTRSHHFISFVPDSVKCMVTGVYENIPYCTPSSVSGRQKKVLFSRQP